MEISWTGIPYLGIMGTYQRCRVSSVKQQHCLGSQKLRLLHELGYDVLPLLWQDTTQYLAPFFRYEKLDTIAKAPIGFADDPTKDWQIYQVGLQYKPIPNVVIKADYRNFTLRNKAALPDDFNLGLGFIF